MSVHEGRVNKVMNGKFGPSFFIAGLDGFVQKGKKFKGKFPKLEVGQTVKVEYEVSGQDQNGRDKHWISQIKILETAPPASAQPGGSTYQDGQAWGGAVARAIEAATLILANGGRKLGAANNHEARKTQIVGLIDELTAKFYSDSTTRSPVKAAQAVAAELDEGEAEESSEGDGEASGDDGAWDDDIPF